MFDFEIVEFLNQYPFSNIRTQVWVSMTFDALRLMRYTAVWLSPQICRNRCPGQRVTIFLPDCTNHKANMIGETSWTYHSDVFCYLLVELGYSKSSLSKSWQWAPRPPWGKNADLLLSGPSHTISALPYALRLNNTGTSDTKLGQHLSQIQGTMPESDESVS